MVEKEFKRKLTGIFSADVAGFSSLMCRDESATVTTLCAYRKAMTDQVKRHRGRVVDSVGDNLLAEFVSVVDAVACAVEVQKELKSRNSDLPEDRRMQFRIGVNLGDVIERDGRLYGTGVNMAARLEEMADPGGICISRPALDHVRDLLPLDYEYLGKYTVKNICREVEAFRVLTHPISPGEEGRVQVKKNRSIIGRKAIFSMMILVAAGAAMWFSMAGGHEKAIKAYRKALHRNPKSLWAQMGLTAAYGMTGREKEARFAAEQILKANPLFSLDYFERVLPYKNQVDKERFVGALRKAGFDKKNDGAGVQE